MINGNPSLFNLRLFNAAWNKSTKGLDQGILLIIQFKHTNASKTCSKKTVSDTNLLCQGHTTCSFDAMIARNAEITLEDDYLSVERNLDGK